MQLDYPTLIEEAPEDLLALERRHRGTPVADRLKMLRLLKTEVYSSRLSLAPVLGYSHRQLQRWWNTYRTDGLEALREHGVSGGATERMTEEAWQALREHMKAGQIARLKDAQQFLSEHFGIRYTVGGLSDLFARHKVKLKTGRRRHQKASFEEQAGFKKTVSA